MVTCMATRATARLPRGASTMESRSDGNARTADRRATALRDASTRRPNRSPVVAPQPIAQRAEQQAPEHGIPGDPPHDPQQSDSGNEQEEQAEQHRDDPVQDVNELALDVPP